MKEPIIPRRTALGLAATPAFMLGTAYDASPAGSKSRTRSVRDFGAKGDGITDDTEAFNRATQADVEWSWNLLCSIIVPAGKYRIKGTVYLRKGQSLIGEGLSTYIDASDVKRSTFIMGRRRSGDRGVQDPGGLPVRIDGLMGLGGAASEGFIYATIPGFQISALFLTAVGLGIEIEAGDGIISDVEIDQCLTGILIRDGQNLVLSNLNMYLANYGVSFAGECRDIAISNSVFCYTKYAAILLTDGVRRTRAVSITGSIFTNNVPYETFAGYIYSRASHSDLLVSGCTFRNSPGYAVNQGAGIDLSMSLSDCVFDGMRSNPEYNQSLSPKGIKTGNGRFTIANCTFSNLSSEAIRVGAGLRSLTVQGGVVDRVARDSIVVDGDPAGPIAIQHLVGLAATSTGGSEHRVTLPWLGPHARWQVTINGRDPNAPTAAAQLLIAPRTQAVTAQIGWSIGEAASVATSVIEANGVRSIDLHLDARQFGTAAPVVDTIASA